MRALLRLQRRTQVSRWPCAAPLPGCPGLRFSSGDAKLPAVVHPAEARAVRVLTAVLTTLLTPLHRPSDIKDECHRETFDGPERQAGETFPPFGGPGAQSRYSEKLRRQGRGL